MSRLKIETPDQAQLTVERLYKDLERHIIASPPGLCPVDLQLSFLKVCHAQTCGKCVPCRVGLGQLQHLMEDVLDGMSDQMEQLNDMEAFLKASFGEYNPADFEDDEEEPADEKKDAELLAWVQDKKFSTYVKKLIREDMKK